MKQGPPFGGSFFFAKKSETNLHQQEFKFLNGEKRPMVPFSDAKPNLHQQVRGF